MTGVRIDWRWHLILSAVFRQRGYRTGDLAYRRALLFLAVGAAFAVRLQM